MILFRLFVLEVVLLFAQFWMGMTNNLFIIVPLDAPFNFLGYAGGVEVLAHVVNGAAILAVAILIIYYSYKAQNKLVLKLSVLAVVFIVSAVLNGTLFLEIFLIPPYRSIDDVFSMAMAMSFLSAFTAIFVLLYTIKNSQKQPKNT